MQYFQQYVVTNYYILSSDTVKMLVTFSNKFFYDKHVLKKRNNENAPNSEIARNNKIARNNEIARSNEIAGKNEISKYKIFFRICAK